MTDEAIFPEDREAKLPPTPSFQIISSQSTSESWRESWAVMATAAMLLLAVEAFFVPIFLGPPLTPYRVPMDVLCFSIPNLFRIYFLRRYFEGRHTAPTHIVPKNLEQMAHTVMLLDQSILSSELATQELRAENLVLRANLFSLMTRSDDPTPMEGHPRRRAEDNKSSTSNAGS